MVFVEGDVSGSFEGKDFANLVIKVPFVGELAGVDLVVVLLFGPKRFVGGKRGVENFGREVRLDS